MRSRPRPKHKELQRQFEEATRRATAPLAHAATRTAAAAAARPGHGPAWLRPVSRPAAGRNAAQRAAEQLRNDGLREKIGDEKLAEYVEDFRQMAQADPTLFGKLYSQPNPYNWMTREVDRLRVARDMGDDPAAYRERILAEGRAQWEAEAKAAPPALSPAAGMQPSLATARSVAGRTAGAWTGEPSLDDVLAPVQNRKKTNGSGGSVRF